MAFAEITVSADTPMPKGYRLLRKGYPFMTALCRRKTRAAGQTLYVVRAGSATVGLRAPRRIVNEVHDEEHQTRAARRAAVAGRDDIVRRAFRAALLRQFPGIPAEDAEAVLRRALKKRSGRVGRTRKLDVEEKVRLAVGAHVRHVHTDYDARVRGGGGQESREGARTAVWERLRGVLRTWEEGGRDGEEEKDDGHGAGDGARSGRRRRAEGSRRRTGLSRSVLSTRPDGGDGGQDVASSLEEPILISSDEDEENDDEEDDNDDEEHDEAAVYCISSDEE